ncbi:tetratricopeptide repeat protein [Methylonatrum kenyense]|uniref:tetratricopeptide repeat protein n=1 Tax=Methylonatrum kenyense TaxID=455253 RepID=UPI0020BE1E7D|nr:tetratricopeptide repeat protein [Methylonatrum kenyense]MCK8516438.1 tetratricopeptide repeat protein [Methylonatrum kenyense]
MRSLLLVGLLFGLAGCAALPGAGDGPDNQVLRLEAHAMHAYHGDEPEEAEALYRQVVERDPSRTQAWFRLGNLTAARGELEFAIEAFDTALELDSDLHRARHNRAVAQLRLAARELEAARESLEREGVDNVYQADRFIAQLLVGLVRSVDLAIDCD